MENAGGKRKYLQFRNLLVEQNFVRFPTIVVARRAGLRFYDHLAGASQPAFRRGSIITDEGGDERDGDWAHVKQGEL
jgi:hypothetical protein